MEGSIRRFGWCVKEKRGKTILFAHSNFVFCHCCYKVMLEEIAEDFYGRFPHLKDLSVVFVPQESLCYEMLHC
jgi:hypothetical protein